MIYRAIKPDNILITRQGDVKLVVDFGLASHQREVGKSSLNPVVAGLDACYHRIQRLPVTAGISVKEPAHAVSGVSGE
ncbi:hypothetical protein ABT316_11025 [Streptomyces cellulosae]